MSTFSIVLTLTLEGIIDYTIDKGNKYFKHAIKSLSNEGFDLSPEDLYLFTNLLTKWVKETSWDAGIVRINTISSDPTNPSSDSVNILYDYDKILLETIQEFKALHIDQESHAA